jgi:hypothetical protein
MGVKKPGKEKEGVVVPIERITQAILMIRGHKVMLDSDLADLYEVETKVLIQAVKRNIVVSRKISCFSLQDRSLTS